MNKRNMTEGAPWRHILRFAVPVLLGSVLQQLYSTVDTVIVGKCLGEAALSAVGTTGSFSFLLLAVALGFSAGNGVVVAQYYGAGDEKNVRAAASVGILFLFGLGAAAALLGVAVARPAYTWLIKVPADFLPQTITYFRIYALGLVFQYGYNVFSSILRAVGDSRATLLFLLISSVLNILLDLLFVAVFSWGVAGAAAATVISQAASCAAANFYMRRRYPVFRFRFRDYRWSGRLAAQTVKIGFPIAVQMIVVSLGMTLIQRAVNGFGRAMTASFTVGQRIETYLNLPCNAFQTTLATYTGQNVGAGKTDRIRKGLRQTMLISLGLTLILSAVILLFTPQIISLFGVSPEAAGYCLRHLRAVTAVNHLILCLYFPVFGVFQGTNHSGLPTLVAMCSLSVRVIVTYLLRYSAFFGYTIIWWNGMFGFSVGFIVTWTFYLTGRWQKSASLTHVPS